ncbi:MAG TPA: 2-hydroxyacyl-CoA dehydratase family protein [Bryobacteraceae bacterium]|nr:2-hydroxyacyl-CoA dehydratase family protein [Bryobacteraceae bacterium]
MAGSATERLTWHYEHPFAAAIAAAGKGTRVAGVTSNTVPWELLRAAGYFPLVLNPARGPVPFAERYMEDGIFGARIRGIFDGLASGAWPFLSLVVIPRTSEQEHKLFLYLKELARQGLSTALPDVCLYNLLHTRSPEAERYGLERTHELIRRLGGSIDDPDLAGAIDESNQACRATRMLLELRAGPEPRLSGTEALALIGAQYFMDRAEYARLADDAAQELSARAPLRAPRIVVQGTPLHHTGLYRAIESHGAVVVGEEDWWGSRSVRNEMPVQGDLVQAIFESYYRHAVSPRIFPREFGDLPHPDGAVFYLPPEDDVLGWEYPRLSKTDIPSLLVREDAAHELSTECHQRIDDFVRGLGR